MSLKTETESIREKCLMMLKDLIAEDQTVYVAIVRVSPSGMSRCMKLYIVKDNKIINITHYVCKVLDYPYTKNCYLRVHGVGMNMIFAVVSHLSYKLFLHSGKLNYEQI